MRGLADIHLDVRGGDIIVDLPGTRYTVTYHKPAVSPQLLAAYLPGENDPRTELTKRSSSQERGAWRTKRLVIWIGSFRQTIYAADFVEVLSSGLSGTSSTNQAQIAASIWFLRQRGQKTAVFVLESFL